MGGSGGGGGSAGEVSWPAAVQDRYNALLGTFAGAVDSTAISSASKALDDAQSLQPYAGKTGYDPISHINDSKNAVSLFGDATADYSPINSWTDILAGASQRYWNIAGNFPVFQEPEPDAWLVMQEIWTFVETVLTAKDNIPTAWTTPTFDAPDDIKDDVAAADQIDAAVTAYTGRVSDKLDRRFVGYDLKGY